MSLESTIQNAICGLTQAIYGIKASLVSPTATGTITTTVATSTGTVTAGAVFVSFENTGATNVTVNSTTLEPDKVMNFPTSNGMVLPAINYAATSGSLTINAVYPPA